MIVSRIRIVVTPPWGHPPLLCRAVLIATIPALFYGSVVDVEKRGGRKIRTRLCPG